MGLFAWRDHIAADALLQEDKTMTAELNIKDIIVGTGKAAERGALITAHYRGWLEDGTELIPRTSAARRSSVC